MGKSEGYNMIRFSYDERLFTFMAMCNAHGYDDENRTMHPIRVMVREKVQGVTSGWNAL